MEKWIQLNSEQAFSDFHSRCNGLHDGYILAADYRKKLIIEDSKTVCSLPDLTMKIIVTSMKDHPVVLLKFSGVMDMRLACGYHDIIDFSMKLGEKNDPLRTKYVLWTCDHDPECQNTSMETERNIIYVIACAAQWRFMETEDYIHAVQSFGEKLREHYNKE